MVVIAANAPARTIHSFFTRNAVKVLLFMLLALLPLAALQAQPANDDCQGAYTIQIGKQGYDTGSFVSPKASLKQAGTQIGEPFHLSMQYAGLDKKSVWYSFDIATARSISITLRQKDSGIAQNDAGIEVYRSSNCLPNLGELSQRLVPITKFGATVSSCVSPGHYLVHVCARNTANDSIWLELKVGDPSPANYDEPANAYDFGMANGDETLDVEFGCLSIDDTMELCRAFGKNYHDYRQSAWFTFTTGAVPDMQDLYGYLTNWPGGTDTVLVGYNIFEGDAHKGRSGLKLVDGCNIFRSICYDAGYCSTLSNPPSFFHYLCFTKPNTTYTIQLLFHKDQFGLLKLQLSGAGKDTTRSADPKHLPADYQLGLVKDGQAKSATDYFSCNGLISRHLCGKANPVYLTDSVWHTNNYRLPDTFDLTNWVTFSIPDSGIAKIECGVWDCDNYNEGDYEEFDRRLYKGDVTKDCNLGLVFKETTNYHLREGLCLPPGTYSFQLSGRTRKWEVKTGCRASDLGKKTVISITFNKKILQPAGRFYKPELAEDLGDITDKLEKGQYVKGTMTNVDPHEDTITIDSLKFHGRFVFRQFYISRPCYIIVQGLSRPGTRSIANILLKGKATDGLSDLQKIDTQYFAVYLNDFYRADSSFFRSYCTPLAPGWYTVLGYWYPSCSDNNYTFTNNINIFSFKYPKPKYDRPYKACLVNNGQPLSWGPNRGSSTYPITDNFYSFPRDSYGCVLDTPLSSHPITICPDVEDDESFGYMGLHYNRVSYYVFTLNKESYLQVYHGAPNSIRLYNIDVRKDSVLMLDSNHIMGSCTVNGEFCRVPPGTYTLAAWGKNTYVCSVLIKVDRADILPEDFASHAINIGSLTPDSRTFSSAPGTFNCATGAFTSDPGIYGGSYYAGSSSIPYPVPDRYAMPEGARKNIWFTFNIPGGGSGDIRLHLQPTASMLNTKFPYAVYESDEDGKLPFSTLQNSGRVDSSLQQHLVQIGRNFPPMRNVNDENDLVISKPDCRPARYYIVVDLGGAYGYNVINPNTQVYFTASYTEVKGAEEGDFCSNAKTINLKAYGSQSAQVLINCHTVGESYGEDNSNMACLGDTSLYKTSWFHFIYTGPDKADLSFKLTENTDALPDQIHYRVLYGRCDAMTPGPCVDNTLSSFRLDCMSQGDYYVQVASPKWARGTVTMEATASPTTYPICKPFSLLKPLANFLPEGGCNGSDITLRNLSTAGKDIQYLWDFGNGQTGSQKQPIVHFSSTKAIDTFMVKLKVTDMLTGLTDETTRPVLLFRDPMVLKLARDTQVLCGSAVRLNAYCNYPNAQVEWTPKTGLDSPYTLHPLLYAYKDIVYHLKVQAANCELEDSIAIHTYNGVKISGGNMLCGDESTRLTASEGYTYYAWSTGERGRSITVTEPGKYIVYANNYTCFAADTFIVKAKDLGPSGIGRDTAVCLGSTFQLKSPRTGVSFLWSTGDTTAAITISKPGIYWLKIAQGDCEHVDTVQVSAKNPGGMLPDTAYLCPGTGVILDAGAADRYDWSTGSHSRRITVDRAGTYQVHLYQNPCDAYDTVQVVSAVAPVVHLGKDTAYCGNLNVTLDAGDAMSYFWQPGGQHTRTIQADHYGTYIVTATNRYGCTASDTINIQEICDPTLFVPNAFIRNQDGQQVFRAVGQDIKTFDMRIYNRWGELLYHSTSLEDGWDGTFQGKDVQMDVYLYVIRYSGFHGAPQEKSGTITLLR